MNIKQFTFILGLILLAIGILGFFPPLVMPTMMNDDRLLFGLFAVNWLHNLVYIGFGLWAAIASTNMLSAKSFCKISSVVFAVIVILGLIPAINTFYGYMPIYGHNVWLNLLIAASTGYFGYARGTRRSMATSY